MEQSLRVKKLEEVQKGEPHMTGIRIRYGGDIRSFDAYKIPLDYLIYNKYNGRIGSHVKSFEKQYRDLNAENLDDAKIIEKFLYESNINRNKTTEEDLVKNGQQKHGIVTSDGIVIDGNRRARLLRKIWHERSEWKRKGHNVDHCQFFISVILPSGADPKEINRLETTYQMGEDEKVDYDPIEKYLKCKELKEKYEFTESDIAEMMGEEEGKIKECLQIMKLMDDYLCVLGYDGIYTRLEKREGPFVDLNN